MKDEFVITLTDIKGPKHFTFPVRVGRLFVLTVLLLALIVPGSFGWLLSLSSGLESLGRDKDQTIQSLETKFNAIRSENHLLSIEAEDARRKIDLFRKKICEIEHILKVDYSKATQLINRINQGKLVLAGSKEDSRDYKKTSTEIIQTAEDALFRSDGLMGQLTLLKWDIERKKQMLYNIPSGFPIPFRGITSPFGARFHPTLQKNAFHTGIDLRAKKGTPVRATADGVVEYAGFHQKSGLGNLLIIRHGFGFSSVFGHLSRLEVRAGDPVTKGELVAHTGNSGLSVGPHLHYEVQFIFKSLNPEPFLKWGWDSFDSIFQKEKGVNWMALQKLLDPPTPQAAIASISRTGHNVTVD